MTLAFNGYQLRGPFYGALAGLLLSKGAAVLGGFAIDDYGVVEHGHGDAAFFISQGRFTYVPLVAALSRMDLTTVQVAWPAVILLFVVCALTIALGLVFVSRGKGSEWMLAVVAFLVASYPFLTEYFTFQSAFYGILLANSFLIGALVLIPWEHVTRDWTWFARLLGAAFCLILGAGVLQQVVVVFAMFVLGRFAFDLGTLPSRFNWRSAILQNTAGPAALLAGVIGYLFLVKLVQAATGIPMDARGSLPDLAALDDRLAMTWDLALAILRNDEVVLSSEVKAVLLLGLLWLAVLVLITSWRRFAVAITLGALLFSAALATTLLGVWWPVPRSVYTVAYAFGVTAAVMIGWLDRLRIAPTLLLALAGLGCVAHSSAMLADQTRINRWDTNTATAIASRLQALGVVGSERQVVLAGVPFNYPVGVDTVFGDTNISALAVPYSADAVFEEATGYVWNVRTGDPSENGCVAAWPAKESVIVNEDDVVVCLSAPVT